MQKIILLLVCISCYHSAHTQILKVSNNIPRKDEKGNILDAHDGNLMYFNNRYYLYGTVYGSTDGFTSANKFRVYSSISLEDWKNEGDLIKDPPKGVYYRPKVIYNATSKKYVLWYNWYPVLWDGKYGVALSDNPTDPFQILNTDVPVTNRGVGDFNLFVDDDGVAYISYNTIENHRIFIERLNKDYTGSDQTVSDEIDNNCEASSLFKRKGLYYLQTDQTCCFCGQGAGSKVFISDKPLTGYVYRGNINRYAGPLAYAANDGSKNPESGVSVSGKKQAEIKFSNSYSINKIKLILSTTRFVSHCVLDDSGKIVSNKGLPEFRIDYQDANGIWQAIHSTAEKIKREYFGTLSFVYDFLPMITKRLRIYTHDISFHQEALLSEIEVMSGNDNIASGQNESYVIEVTSDTIPKNANGLPPIIPAQQTYVARLPTQNGDVYVWMGDLWGSRPDQTKGHDFQFWYPLQFEKDGTIKPLEWINEWTLYLKAQ